MMLVVTMTENFGLGVGFDLPGPASATPT